MASGRGTGWGPAAFPQGEPRGQGSCPLLPPIPAFSWGPRWPNPSGGRRAGGPGGRSPQHPLPGRKAGGERWAWDLGGSGARPARSLSLSELGAASATCRFVTKPPNTERLRVWSPLLPTPGPQFRLASAPSLPLCGLRGESGNTRRFLCWGPSRPGPRPFRHLNSSSCLGSQHLRWLFLAPSTRPFALL